MNSNVNNNNNSSNLAFTDLGLNDKLLKVLTKLNFIKATKVQKSSINVLLEGNDVLISSPTGTGKTLAFIIPIIQYLFDFPRNQGSQARVLIIAPTRDLVKQIHSDLNKITSLLNFNTVCITGDLHKEEHSKLLSFDYDIIVATPGRIASYIVDGVFYPDEVEILVLDEADKLMLNAHEDTSSILTSTINRKNLCLCSATLFNSEIQNAYDKLFTKEPILISHESSSNEKKNISHKYYHCDSKDHKRKILCRILSNKDIKKCIVFVNKKESVQELANYLIARSIRASFLEGDMHQRLRDRAINLLKDGLIQVLVSTDLSSRGINIEDLDVVINYDIPYKGDIYTHRVGRTGRFFKKGIAISLVELFEYKYFGKILRFTKSKVSKCIIDDLLPKTEGPHSVIDYKETKIKEKVKNNLNKVKKKINKDKKKIRHRDIKNKGKPKPKI